VEVVLWQVLLAAPLLVHLVSSLDELLLLFLPCVGAMGFILIFLLVLLLLLVSVPTVVESGLWAILL